MRKIVYSLAFFIVFSVLGIIASKSAYAVTLSGTLDNRAGGIDISVNVYVFRANSTYVTSPSMPIPVTVVKGTTTNFFATDATSNAPYFMTWSTSCDSSSMNASGTFFPLTDVHCTTTNSNVSITSTACPQSGGVNTGQVNWSISNTTNPNIANYKVFKALNADPDTDTSPTTVNFGTNTLSMNSLANGTWNVRVKAYPPNNNPGIAISNGQFVCGSGVTGPYGLNANVSCNGTQNLTTFTWVGASPGTYTYQIQSGVGPTGGNWDSFTATPNPNTSTYVVSTSFIGSLYQYTARVVATPSPPTGATYISPSVTFVTPYLCPGTTVAVPVIYRIRNCYDLSTNSPAPPDPNKVKVDWYRASPTSEIVFNGEFLEFSTNSSFNGTYDSYGVPGLNSYLINSNFTDGATYHFRIRTQLTSGEWIFSPTVSVLIPGTCPGTNGFSTTLQGYADCHPDGLPRVHLQWTKQVNDSDPQFNIRKLPAGAFTSTIDYYWDSNAEVPGSYSWTISGVTDVGGSLNVVSSIVITAPDCSLPNPPIGLTAAPAACNASLSPVINFRFTDGSNNETAFWLEVSQKPFNVAGEWATKVLPAINPTAEKNFYWSNAATSSDLGAFDSGDANPLTPSTTDGLIPVEGASYYWRVKAVNGQGQGTYKYNDSSWFGTFFAPGMLVKAGVCRPQHDLEVRIDGGSWRDQNGNYGSSFSAGETATVDVNVTNVAGANATTLPTTAGNTPDQLWFYYTAPAPGACVGGSPPSGSTGKSVSLGLGAGGLAVGAAVKISVSFLVPTATTGLTAYANVAPTCTFAAETPIAGVDPDGSNNVTSASYTVGVSTYFETVGGDVGVAPTRDISVGVNSSFLTTPNTPRYQSQYLLAGDSVNSLANTPSTGFKISNYSNKRQAPAGGVYEYFRSRYRSKATTEKCTFASGTITVPNGLYYCGGTVTITNLNTQISGNAVFFIDGDLDLSNPSVAGLSLSGAASTAVYIVKGNIILGINARTLAGIFIAGGDFTDCPPGGSCNITVFPTNTMKLTGALYVDGKINMPRYYTTIGDNAIYPTDQFTFDPKYVVALSQLLSQTPVGWKEVAP